MKNDEDKKPKKPSPFTLVALGVVIFAVMLSIFDPNKSTGKKEELTISAAMSLKDAFTQIGTEFEKSHPQCMVFYNFGSSGELAEQIRQGSPADVFASADQETMDALVAKNLVDKTSVKNFARNSLVVISSAADNFHSFEELGKVNRLAIGDPMTVPAGKYAEQALQKAQIFTTLQQDKKLIYGENVRQVLTYVESKNADAGLVYATDTKISQGVATCFSVPDNFTSPIVYPIAVVSSSNQKPLAQQFVDLVVGPRGQDILQQKGFLK